MRKPLTLFGKRLRLARNQTGISQKQLGIKIGLDEAVASARMNQYEVGSHSPKFITASKIAEALNVPVPYFYSSDDDFAQMIMNFGSLDIVKQRTISEHIQRLLKE